MREIPLVALLALAGVDCATPPTKVQPAAEQEPEEIDPVEFYRSLATLQRKSMKTVYDHIKSRHKLTNMYVCAGFSVYETPHGELTVVTAGNMINVTEDSKGKVQVLERLPTKTSERGRACRRIVPLPNSTISLRVENSPFFYQVDQQTAQDASMGGYPLPNFRDILPHTSSKRIEVTPTLKDMVEHAIEAGPIRGRSRYWGIIQPNDAIQSL